MFNNGGNGWMNGQKNPRALPPRRHQILPEGLTATVLRGIAKHWVKDWVTTFLELLISRPPPNSHELVLRPLGKQLKSDFERENNLVSYIWLKVGGSELEEISEIMSTSLTFQGRELGCKAKMAPSRSYREPLFLPPIQLPFNFT